MTAGNLFIAGTRRVARRRFVTVLALVVAAAVTAGVVRHFWSRDVAPEPPAVERTGVDPAIVAAIEQARGVVLQAPHSAAAWGQLGMVLTAHDFRGEANVCFARAEQLDPREPRWPYHQGIALTLGDPPAALAKLRRAVELAGDAHAAPRLWLGEVLLGQGSFGEAEANFQQLLRHDPLNPWAHLGLCRLALQRRDSSAAVAHAHQAEADPRTRKAAHTLLAEIRQRLGDAATASRELALANAALPDHPWPDPFVEEVARLRTGEGARLEFAAQLLEQDRIAEALPLLRQTAQGYPNSAVVWLFLGRAMARAGDLDGAERALRKTVQLAPKWAEARYDLGSALWQRRKFGMAVESFRKAKELKPDYAQAYYGLGQCLLGQGDRWGAAAALRDAIRYKPDHVEARTDLAELLAQDGQEAEAAVLLQEAVRLSPGAAKAKRLLLQHWLRCCPVTIGSW
jgi:superkiller protein 3